MKHIVMLVADEQTTKEIKSALQNTYEVIAASPNSVAAGLAHKPDIILLDEENGGCEVLKRLREKEIPVIMLAQESTNYEGLSLGAADYVSKPPNEKILQKRIQTQLELAKHTQSIEKIENLQDAILSTVAEMVEFRDDNTGGHIVRTQCYLKALVEKMLERGIYKNTVCTINLERFIRAAELHDVGKISIPDSILNKAGRLTDEEFSIMKTHAEQGRRVIAQIVDRVEESDFLHQSELMAYTHHEKWDGTGYPQGLAGEEIPIHGRLMAIADVYDALISARPYKKAFTHEEAVRIIAEGRGTQFDPLLTDIFVEIEAEFDRIAKTHHK